MICLNELGACHKREILDVTILISPFAPHIAEELWEVAGHTESIFDASYPECDESLLVESSFEYPVMMNGKLRFKVTYDLTKDNKEIESEVITHEIAQKWLEGGAPKKVIVVKGKIINIVY